VSKRKTKFEQIRFSNANGEELRARGKGSYEGDFIIWPGKKKRTRNKKIFSKGRKKGQDHGPETGDGN